MKSNDENDRPPEPDAAPEPGTDPGAPDGAAAGGSRARPADVQAYIGRQLRAVYEDVVRQPIPDRFLALMKQLEDPSPEG